MSSFDCPPSPQPISRSASWPHLFKLIGWGGRFLGSLPRNTLARFSECPPLMLMYHRVTELPKDPHSLCVSPDHFRQQMAWLKNKFTPIPLLSWTQPGVGKGIRVIVTFDDGYADNLNQALPVLEKYEIPATIFICTNPVERQIEFPTDRFDRLLDDAEIGRLGNITFPNGIRLEEAMASTSRNELHRYFYRLTPGQREAFLSPAEAALNYRAARESHRPLTVQEVQRLGRHPLITLGSHTVNHPCLATLNPAEQRREIFGAHLALSDWIGKSVRTFAYPYGKEIDYTKETSDICAELGLACAVTTTAGKLWPETRPYLLPRFPVRNWPGSQFKNMLKLYEWLQ